MQCFRYNMCVVSVVKKVEYCVAGRIDLGELGVSECKLSYGSVYED